MLVKAQHLLKPDPKFVVVDANPGGRKGLDELVLVQFVLHYGVVVVSFLVLNPETLAPR